MTSVARQEDWWFPLKIHSRQKANPENFVGAEMAVENDGYLSLLHISLNCPLKVVDDAPDETSAADDEKKNEKYLSEILGTRYTETRTTQHLFAGKRCQWTCCYEKWHFEVVLQKASGMLTRMEVEVREFGNYLRLALHQ